MWGRENSFEILFTEYMTRLGLYKVFDGIQHLFLTASSTRLVSVLWEATKPSDAAIPVSGSGTSVLGNNTSFTSKVANICCAVGVEKSNRFIKINALTLCFVNTLEKVDIKPLFMSLLELLE